MSESSPTFADRVRASNLPLEKIIVVGSGILDILGLRMADDVDLVVTEDVLREYIQSNPSYVPHDVPGDIVYDDKDNNIAASLAWRAFPDGENVYYDDLLTYTTIVDGVRYVSLDYLLRWKQWANREKDQADIMLIEEYLHAKEIDTHE